MGKKSWTKEEEEKLRRLIKERFWSNWKELAKHFPGKDHDCLRHKANKLGLKLQEKTFQGIKVGPLTKKRWTIEEKEKLIRLVSERSWKSYAELAEHFPGRNKDSVKGQCRTLGIKPNFRKPTADALRRLERGEPITEEEKRRLEAEGYLLREVHGEVRLQKMPPPPELVAIFKLIPHLPEKFTLGAISDTHYGSVWCAEDFIPKVVRKLEEGGADLIVHCGDWLDGVLRSEVVQSQNAIGADAQVNRCAKLFPKTKVPIVGIGGSHDASFLEKFGLDVLKLLQWKRPDIRFLGYYEAQIQLTESVTLGIMHPSGGQAYCRTYRMQKLMEQLGPLCPTVLLLGHFHYAAWLPYLGKYAFHVPSLEYQTRWMRQKVYLPVLGGLLIHFEFEGPKLKRLLWEYVPGQ